ncbi:MAG TPA: hypothetical protein VGF88_16725 [Acidobacteriaceae bacterium]|jgi:hypothetical protein
MSISSSELIGLLRGTLPAAAPSERGVIETYIAFIDRQGVIATQDSEASRFLERTAGNFHDRWEPDVASNVQSVELYGVDVPLINAFARKEEGVEQIVLFEGIKQIVMFHAHLVTVLNLLNRLRGDRYVNIDGWKEEEAAAFSLAAFSLLYEYMKTGQPLIAIGDILGPRALQNTRLGYEAAIAFILAHEVGHLALGHIGSSGAVSERNGISLAIEETINDYQQREFEADRYALFGFREHLRVPLMSSVIFFFGPLAFIEAFVGPHDPTHPLFTNRAAHLASLLPRDTEDGMAVANIIRSQTEGFRRVAAKRGAAGEDIRPRIHQTMPVELAYRVIFAVKEAVASEMGILDLEDEPQVSESL